MTQEKQLENQIPYTSDLVKKLCCNAKITGIENKIPSFNVLVSNSALTAVGNKTPNVSNLVKTKQIMMQKVVELKRNFWSWSW